MANKMIINDNFMSSMKDFMDEMEYEMKGIKIHHLVDILLKYGYHTYWLVIGVPMTIHMKRTLLIKSSTSLPSKMW